MSRAKLTTNFGEIIIELNTEKAPISSENFKKYIEDGFYENTIFHRVIGNFMIQGGGFMTGMIQKQSNPSIENEAKNGLSNETYSLAMARTNDPHSASSQFFINVQNNTSLDYPAHDGWGYAVFGKVTEGMDVVDKIKGVATANNMGHQDVPVEDVVIEKAEMI